MDARSLVKEVLCALVTGNIERHLSYIADNVVLEDEAMSERIEGLAGYRTYVTRVEPQVYLQGFQLMSAEREGDT